MRLWIVTYEAIHTASGQRVRLEHATGASCADSAISKVVEYIDLSGCPGGEWSAKPWSSEVVPLSARVVSPVE